MSRFAAIAIIAAFSVAYWAVVGPWAGRATYGWALDPEFGTTDAMSIWPNIIAVVGYFATVAVFAVVLTLAKRRRKNAEEKR